MGTTRAPRRWRAADRVPARTPRHGEAPPCADRDCAQARTQRPCFLTRLGRTTQTLCSVFLGARITSAKHPSTPLQRLSARWHVPSYQCAHVQPQACCHPATPPLTPAAACCFAATATTRHPTGPILWPGAPPPTRDPRAQRLPCSHGAPAKGAKRHFMRPAHTLCRPKTSWRLTCWHPWDSIQRRAFHWPKCSARLGCHLLLPAWFLPLPAQQPQLAAAVASLLQAHHDL